MRRSRLFLAGGIFYPLLEFIWRGRSHWSMSLVGALGSLALGQVARLPRTYICRCLLAALSLTVLELSAGLLLNKHLHWQIWDYSGHRCNFLGQVSLKASCRWLALSALLLPLLSGKQTRFGRFHVKRRIAAA